MGKDKIKMTYAAYECRICGKIVVKFFGGTEEEIAKKVDEIQKAHEALHDKAAAYDALAWRVKDLARDINDRDNSVS